MRVLANQQKGATMTWKAAFAEEVQGHFIAAQSVPAVGAVITVRGSSGLRAAVSA